MSGKFKGKGRTEFGGGTMSTRGIQVEEILEGEREAREAGCAEGWAVVCRRLKRGRGGIPGG